MYTEHMQSQEESLHAAFAVISEELRKLQSEVDRIIEIYFEAVKTNDLTFIKIIEDKYRTLSIEVALLCEKVMREQQSVFEQTSEENWITA